MTRAAAFRLVPGWLETTIRSGLRSVRASTETADLRLLHGVNTRQGKFDMASARTVGSAPSRAIVVAIVTVCVLAVLF